MLSTLWSFVALVSFKCGDQLIHDKYNPDPTLDPTKYQPLSSLSIVNSFVNELFESQSVGDNKAARHIYNGHFVRVAPTPLPHAALVASSPGVLAMLGLNSSANTSMQFLHVLSGHEDDHFGPTGWATPYSISIYGQEITPPNSGPRGDGYGDGRVISIAEVVLPSCERSPPSRSSSLSSSSSTSSSSSSSSSDVAVSAAGVDHASTTSSRASSSVWESRLELQLKGSGPTPFCRGADGRAVLRSSVREFLASEAMHFLGVSTTRALSLIVSKTEKVLRPWYTANTSTAPTSRHGGDITRLEPVAMVCRVSPSFIRVGTFELYARRVQRGEVGAYEELKALTKHTLKREFPEIDRATSLQAQVLTMLQSASMAFAKLSADWIRVGYAQSNFNSDNCLVAGRTVDYGPFGFLELFKPDWGMWIGAGDHFAFMNQPSAAHANFRMLAKSLVPLLDDVGISQADEIVQSAQRASIQAVDDMFASKMGFSEAQAETRALWTTLQVLMEECGVDWTIFWRQLADAIMFLPLKPATTARGGGDVGDVDVESNDDDDDDEDEGEHHASVAAFEVLAPCFYFVLTQQQERLWKQWLQTWMHHHIHIARERERERERQPELLPRMFIASVSAQMKLVSPKYIPREWMLMEAYRAAEMGNYTVVQNLLQVFSKPYEEQPWAAHTYYTKGDETNQHQGGLGFMS